MFPAPELVYTDIYMVGVPYFLEEILSVEPPTSRRQKKHGDPNSTMSSTRNTSPTLPPDAPPLAPLDANTYAAGTAVSATSNSSGGPNGAHRFVVVASSSHFIVDATCYGSHLNSNKYFFSSFNNADPSHIMLVDCCMLYCRECGPIAAV